MAKKRTAQIHDALNKDPIDLKAHHDLLNAIYLFSTEHNRIVGTFMLPGKGQIEAFEIHTACFTKTNPKFIVLANRNHVIINDNNYFACVAGKWSGMSSDTFSHVIMDMQHLFSAYQSALTDTCVERSQFAVEASIYGGVDTTLSSAYNAGIMQANIQQQVNRQRAGLQQNHYQQQPNYPQQHGQQIGTMAGCGQPMNPNFHRNNR